MRKRMLFLPVGLEVSSYVSVDDTGARHQRQNGYCTHIGNELFSWFESTPTKSRINFLRLLRAGRTDYVINGDAANYWEAHKLPRAVLDLLCADEPGVFAEDALWEQYLKQKGVQSARHIQIATEGALIGSIIEHGISKNLVVVSDDAGQFNVLLHALCWIYAERSINKINPMSEQGRDNSEQVPKQLWQLYGELKAYKLNPHHRGGGCFNYQEIGTQMGTKCALTESKTPATRKASESNFLSPFLSPFRECSCQNISPTPSR